MKRRRHQQRRKVIFMKQQQRQQRTNSKNKKEITEWALDQFTKYGVKQPDTYTADELKYLNPGVPTDFIDRHVAKRKRK